MTECEKIRAEIPASQFEEWGREFEEYCEPDRARIPREVWDAGSWLAQKLREAGAGEELAHLIVQGVGQRQAMVEPGVDLWLPAVTALANYAKGEWELPGEELADKLLVERFGNPPDREKMLAWLLSSPVGKQALNSALGQ